MKEIFKRHPRYRTAPESFTELPDDLWVRCDQCRELVYAKEYEDALWVCSKCKYHAQITARQRIDITVDPGSFYERDAGIHSSDPLTFRSGSETYANKLREWQDKTGTREAFLYGIARLDGKEIVLGVAEFKFSGGSLNGATGEKIARAFNLAGERSVPLILFSSGGGARMQEGTISLLQMAKTVAALDRFKESGQPYLSVMTDPCVGGITASYAMLGDVNIAEPGAYIGFAGRRVIEQTTHQKLPQSAARAEFLLEHGMIDLVVARAEMRSVLGRLLEMYAGAGSRAAEKRLVGQGA
ncbi:MAG TPA: acetyl-CoA carboxylase, carboxyltransferase subunit beta [Chloroflexota bacterium]|nr:acetyl-CoA carboxylase, carboxyltransferase subunit beta [Chloroflexota bacterium]